MRCDVVTLTFDSFIDFWSLKLTSLASAKFMQLPVGFSRAFVGVR